MLVRSTARLARIQSHLMPVMRLSTLTPATAGSNPEVLFQQKGNAHIVTLNRPKALNSLNLNMVHLMMPYYKKLASGSKFAVVLMKGSGEKAFCAGGDIRAIYDNRKAGKPVSVLTEFFNKEYELDYAIASLPSHVPHVALLNGITMGGGVGLSVHGRYRVATDNTVFAMPETAIGFFCDVGGSHFLPRLSGSLGMYLALTGARLKGADVFHAGVATHFVKAENFARLEEQLASANEGADVERILGEFAEKAPELKNSIAPVMDAVNRCFSGDSVEAIVAALEKENSDWAKAQLTLLGRMSPTSLKVVHRQLREGAKRNLADCFKMETTMAEEFMRRDDFFEGVRAVLVDKDQKPAWKPASLADVRTEDVAKYFAA